MQTPEMTQRLTATCETTSGDRLTLHLDIPMPLRDRPTLPEIGEALARILDSMRAKIQPPTEETSL